VEAWRSAPPPPPQSHDSIHGMRCDYEILWPTDRQWRYTELATSFTGSQSLKIWCMRSDKKCGVWTRGEIEEIQGMLSAATRVNDIAVLRVSKLTSWSLRITFELCKLYNVIVLSFFVITKLLSNNKDIKSNLYFKYAQLRNSWNFSLNVTSRMVSGNNDIKSRDTVLSYKYDVYLSLGTCFSFNWLCI
jgi:hypothetical protein